MLHVHVGKLHLDFKKGGGGGGGGLQTRPPPPPPPTHTQSCMPMFRCKIPISRPNLTAGVSELECLVLLSTNMTVCDVDVEM